MEQVTRGKGLLENYLAKQRAKICDSYIPDELREGNILDIGCGKIPYFLQMTRFLNKYGIDKGIIITHNRIELINIDVTKQKIPYKKEKFDVITMLAVIEHLTIKQAIKLLREIHRLLKPNGKLIITSPTKKCKPLLKTLAILGLISKEELYEHKRLYDKMNYELLLISTGFEIDKEQTFQKGFNKITRAKKECIK